MIADYISSDKATIRFFNADNMLFMKDVPDKYYDLAIVDPPYGIKPNHNFGVKETIRFDKEDVKWDILPEKIFFNELNRISKNQIIWGGNYFIDYLYSTRCFIIWDKENGNNPFADCEMAWTSFDNSARIYRYFWLGSHIHRLEDVIHPTQKPIKLYRWLLQNYAKPGQKIFDSHGGSFSHAIACDMEGFDLDIVELDPEYFKTALERFKIYKSQKVLF